MLEKRAYDLFLQNLIKGTSHLSLGQEAIAAGFGTRCAGRLDVLHLSRPRPHARARRVDDGDLGELMGGIVGLLRGKGGSMHLTTSKHNVMGSYAIIGAHLPVANGAAWSAQYRGTEQVAVCFFGDGTTNIGAFHEALNFAVGLEAAGGVRLREQPLHGVHADRRRDGGRASGSRPRERVRTGAGPHRRQRRRRRLPTALRALELARRGGGPTPDRGETYRHSGHSRADPGKYRPDEESSRSGCEAIRSRSIAARCSRSGFGESDAARRSTTRPRRKVDEATETREGVAAAVARRSREGRVGRRRLSMAELTYRDAVARGIAQEMRRDRTSCSSARTSPPPAACSRRPSACSKSSARSACATRRSRSRRYSAPRWAPR